MQIYKMKYFYFIFLFFAQLKRLFSLWLINYKLIHFENAFQIILSKPRTNKF